MELTLDQALQQGIAAHREGKLQDAERLYRAILQVQPNHPDANHNLGALAVAVGKPLEAIPLFKLALETNPKIEQFWLSYIDALTEVDRFDEAREVLASAERSGVSGEKLGALHQHLQVGVPEDAHKGANTQTLSEKRKRLAEKKKNKKRKAHNGSLGAAPSQDQCNQLLGHYQAGRLEDAEALAKSLTQKFSKHPFAWKVLGAVLKQMNRPSESLPIMHKCVQLAPQDPSAHSNFGAVLHELGRLTDAKESYEKALALNSNLAEAHSNLGNTLRKMGELSEAEACYRKAIAINPKYFDAHNNLGTALRELGRLDDAEVSCRQAIVLNPAFADAHANLAATLLDKGRLQEAECISLQAIALDSRSARAHYNLGVALQELGRLKEAEASYRQAISLQPDLVDAHRNLALTLLAIGKLDEVEGSFRRAISLDPDSLTCHSELLKYLYRREERQLFLDELQSLVNLGKANSLTGSLACRAVLKYEAQITNLFCGDPLAHITHTDLSAKYDFEKSFIETAQYVLNRSKLVERKQALLLKGYQTAGNLFDIESDLMSVIHEALRVEIENYRRHFIGSHEGIIKKWPKNYSLFGWLVSLRKGGELKPHIHERGWLSGTVYINVPEKKNPDDGNLVVALGEDSDVIEAVKNKKKIINVITGSLVLFPSSLTHHTIPFEAEEERISLAFDMIPAPG